MVKSAKEMRKPKKMSSKAKDFHDEGFNQGSKKMPMKQVKEYGTGLPEKKPKAPMAKKPPVSKGR